MTTASIADLYGLLGVERSALPNEIAAAFRARAKELHPDRLDGDVERFKELSRAYGVLSDPARRRRYDDWLAHRDDASTAPVIAVRHVAMFATIGRARLAFWVGLILVFVGLGLALIVPALGESTKGSTFGRDLALWIAAVKLVVSGGILAVVGGRRTRRLRAQSNVGSF